MKGITMLLLAALLLAACGKNEGNQEGASKSKSKSGSMKFRFPEIQSPQDGAAVDREFEVTLSLPDKYRGDRSRWWLVVERDDMVWPLFNLTTVEKMHTVKVKERCSYKKDGPFELRVYLEIMGPDKFDEYLEREKQGDCTGIPKVGKTSKGINGYTSKGTIKNLRYK